MTTIHLAGRQYNIVSHFIRSKEHRYALYRYNDVGKVRYALIESNDEEGARVIVTSGSPFFNWEQIALS